MSNQCIFCSIIKEEKPIYKVFENELFLGFLDTKPLNPGNTLLIPKTHYRWVYDVPAFGTYFEVAKKISLAIQKATNCQSVSLLTLGYEVPHAHIRIIPRFENDGHKNGISLRTIKKISPEKMKEIAKSIQTYL